MYSSRRTLESIQNIVGGKKEVPLSKWIIFRVELVKSMVNVCIRVTIEQVDGKIVRRDANLIEDFRKLLSIFCDDQISVGF